MQRFPEIAGRNGHSVSSWQIHDASEGKPNLPMAIVAELHSAIDARKPTGRCDRTFVECSSRHAPMRDNVVEGLQ